VRFALAIFDLLATDERSTEKTDDQGKLEDLNS